MTDERARPSQSFIEAYRTQQAQTWEQELFKQRKRLVDAQRKLTIKETKAARNDERIANNRLEQLTNKLATLRSEQISTNDLRISRKITSPR